MVIRIVERIVYMLQDLSGKLAGRVRGEQNPVYIRDMQYTTKEHPTADMGGGTRAIKL